MTSVSKLWQDPLNSMNILLKEHVVVVLIITKTADGIGKLNAYIKNSLAVADGNMDKLSISISTVSDEVKLVSSTVAENNAKVCNKKCKTFLFTFALQPQQSTHLLLLCAGKCF